MILHQNWLERAVLVYLLSPCPCVRSNWFVASVASVLASLQVKSSLNFIKPHVQESLWLHSFDQILSILPVYSRIHAPKSHNLWVAFAIKLMRWWSIGALSNTFIEYWAPSNIFITIHNWLVLFIFWLNDYPTFKLSSTKHHSIISHQVLQLWCTILTIQFLVICNMLPSPLAITDYMLLMIIHHTVMLLLLL